MERTDHPAELFPRGGSLRVAGVSRLGGREGDRVVAPEVAQPLAGERVDERAVQLVELVDRQQLDGGDTQLLQVGDLLDQAGEGAGVSYAGGGVDGEAADMQLVEDRVLAVDARADIVGDLRHRSIQQAASAASCPARPKADRTKGPERRGRAGPTRSRSDARGPSGRQRGIRNRTPRAGPPRWMCQLSPVRLTCGLRGISA